MNEAISTFETKKKAFVDGQIERIRDLTTTLNGVLRTMHLPEAIEETSGSGVHEEASVQSKLDPSARQG